MDFLPYVLYKCSYQTSPISLLYYTDAKKSCRSSASGLQGVARVEEDESSEDGRRAPDHYEGDDGLVRTPDKVKTGKRKHKFDNAIIII
jgi:hypothetical protein